MLFDIMEQHFKRNVGLLADGVKSFREVKSPGTRGNEARDPDKPPRERPGNVPPTAGLGLGAYIVAVTVLPVCTVAAAAATTFAAATSLVPGGGSGRPDTDAEGPRAMRHGASVARVTRGRVPTASS